MKLDHLFAVIVASLSPFMIYAAITVPLPGCASLDADLERRTSARLPEDGIWVEVPPPAIAPNGTRCVVWRVPYGNSAFGGPQCFLPTPQVTP